MRDILWDKVMLEDFRRLACLTEDEDMVLPCWAKGWSIAKIAMHCHFSERSVSDKIKAIRRKYDSVCIYSPLLPSRK